MQHVMGEQKVPKPDWYVCWFSCFHSLCYLGKTTVWDQRQLNHIYAIIKKSTKGKKYQKMRSVPLSSFTIIKIPVDPATLDAWEDLLIHQFKPSLNSKGIPQALDPRKIISACGISKIPHTQPLSSTPLSMQSLASKNLSSTIFSSASWSSTSLITLMENFVRKRMSTIDRIPEL